MKGTIKQHRLWKGLTQTEVADQLGVVRQTYINWENNPNRLTIEKAEKIAAALDVDFDDLIFSPLMTTDSCH